LKSGERLIALGEIDGTYRRGQARQPVRRQVPQPVVFTQFGAMVMANAPQPKRCALLRLVCTDGAGSAWRRPADSKLRQPDELARKLAADRR
jgi:hypothetical protein